MQDMTPMQSRAVAPVDPGQIPVIPLPNPGEGGPVYSGDDPAQIPAIPLPNPGEGGPVYPGYQPLPPVPVYVIPNASVRFINATYGYPSLRVSIDGTRVVTLLSSGDAACPSRIAAGAKIVSVIGADGYIYLQKQLSFRAGRTYLIVISNRNGGIDLTQAEDACI